LRPICIGNICVYHIVLETIRGGGWSHLMAGLFASRLAEYDGRDHSPSCWNLSDGWRACKSIRQVLERAHFSRIQLTSEGASECSVTQCSQLMSQRITQWVSGFSFQLTAVQKS
jgi:hypothetical protein